MKKTEAELWREFKKKKKDMAAREKLIELHMPFVEIIASRIKTRLPYNADIEDMVSAGYVGLIQAVDNFDISRDLKFKTYCSQRIVGAVIDYLRALDHIPRLVRNLANKIKSARSALYIELGRMPSDSEVAGYMNLTRKEYMKIILIEHNSTLMSLDECFVKDDMSKDVTGLEIVENKKAPNPAKKLHREEVKEIIMRGLSKREMAILELYYFESRTMYNISIRLNMTDSGVSQLHSHLMTFLQKKLADREDELL